MLSEVFTRRTQTRRLRVAVEMSVDVQPQAQATVLRENILLHWSGALLSPRVSPQSDRRASTEVALLTRTSEDDGASELRRSFVVNRPHQAMPKKSSGQERKSSSCLGREAPWKSAVLAFACDGQPSNRSPQTPCVGPPSLSLGENSTHDLCGFPNLTWPQNLLLCFPNDRPGPRTKSHPPLDIPSNVHQARARSFDHQRWNTPA